MWNCLQVNVCGPYWWLVNIRLKMAWCCQATSHSSQCWPIGRAMVSCENFWENWRHCNGPKLYCSTLYCCLLLPRYCLHHTRRALRMRQQASRKPRPKENPENLLENLEQHVSKPDGTREVKRARHTQEAATTRLLGKLSTARLSHNDKIQKKSFNPFHPEIIWGIIK